MGANIPLTLPSPLIRHRWVKVESDPKSNRIGRKTMIVDRCYNRDGGIHSIHVAYVSDHPFLKVLDSMDKPPRRVKSMYRASVRLRVLRAAEAAPILADWMATDEAWLKWRSVQMNRP